MSTETPSPLTLELAVERWPLRHAFAISRGAKSEAVVVVATLSDGSHRGRGECVPYGRYGESIESISKAIEAMRPALARYLNRAALQLIMPAGSARNALDCALWDLEAKRARRPVYELASLAAPHPLITAYTISLAPPSAMALAAAEAGNRPLLKIKLGGDDENGGDPARIAAVRNAAPTATLIVDANEGWQVDNLAANVAACVKAGVMLIEQPLREGHDRALIARQQPIMMCADESVHDRASLAGLVGRYNAVNIKLDKAGGLTEALAMMAEAKQLGFTVMVGSMVSTSLAAAPAVLVAQDARYVDLDGPLLLAKDRVPGLIYQDSRLWPPTPALWG